jgi:hypothetical protein
MLAKIGRLLYWVGSGLAAVALVSGVFILQHGLDQDYRWGVYVVSIGSAVVFWLLGRACNPIDDLVNDRVSLDTP